MLQLLSRVTAKLSSPQVKLKSYDSFDAALADSNSYEDHRLIRIVSEKTRRYRETLSGSSSRMIESRQTAQNMFVLSVVEPQRPINVLEIGGACGASYFEAKHLLPERIQHWSISETGAMAAAGQALNDDSALSFHSDMASALQGLASRDLAIIQGTLQYVPEPLQTLRELFQHGFNHIYLTRTPVTNLDATIFTKQETDLSAHGPGKLPHAANGKSSQPLTLLSRDAVFSVVPENYEIVFEFEESDDRNLLVGERAVDVRDIGFLARKRVYSHL